MEMKKRQWTILTNHAAVFIHLLEHNEATIRSIADELGLAERTVVGVLQDLRGEGYLLARKQGSHNVYHVNPEGLMKRPEHMGYTLRDFLIRVLAAMEKLTPEGLDAGTPPTPKKTLPSVLKTQ